MVKKKSIFNNLSSSVRAKTSQNLNRTNPKLNLWYEIVNKKLLTNLIIIKKKKKTFLSHPQ